MGFNIIWQHQVKIINKKSSKKIDIKVKNDLFNPVPNKNIRQFIVLSE